MASGPLLATLASRALDHTKPPPSRNRRFGRFTQLAGGRLRKLARGDRPRSIRKLRNPALGRR